MIRLEKFTENDFDNLISWCKNEEDLIQFAGSRFTFPLTKDQLFNYVSDSNINPFKVIHKKDNIHIGHAEIFMLENNPPKFCRIIIGGKSYRGQGLGKQIIKELIKICINKYQSTRVELNVFDWNESAIKCYEKVGFTMNKKIQKEIIINGNSWISVNMFLDIDPFNL